MLQNIINKKLHCVIVSPHYDDAVLSCGALISELSGKTNLTIVNVFTQAHSGPYTLSAKKFLEYSGNYTDAQQLFRDREKEDQSALSKFKTNIINLDFIDALFRKNSSDNWLTKLLPELNHTYPTYRWHINQISPSDDILNDLAITLEKIIDKNSLVFVPYGIWNHVDHLITRKVAEMVFGDNVVLYSDFPYNLRTNNYGSATKDQIIFELAVDLPKKSKMLKAYRSQFSGLFDNKDVPAHKEVYFINKNLNLLNN